MSRRRFVPKRVQLRYNADIVGTERCCCAKDWHSLDTRWCLPCGAPVCDAESTEHAQIASEKWFRGATGAVSFFFVRDTAPPDKVPQIRTVYAVPPRHASPPPKKNATFFFEGPRVPPPASGTRAPTRSTGPRWCSESQQAGVSHPCTRAAEHDERLWDSGCGSVRLSINLAVVFDPWPKQQQQEQRVGLCCFVATAVCCATIYRQQHKSRALLVRCAVRCFS